MQKTFDIIRRWVVPLLSLVATAILPISSPWLWLIWGIAFVAVLEGGCSASLMLRPALWIGAHATVIMLTMLLGAIHEQ